MINLKSPPNRLYNLYLSNYCSHVAKRRLKNVLIKNAGEIPTHIFDELVITLNQFKILDDIENPKENICQIKI